MRNMATQSGKDEESFAIITDMRDKLLEFIESSERISEAHDSRIDALQRLVNAADARVDTHGNVVDAVSKSQTATNDVLEIVKQGLAEWMTKLDSFDGKVDGLQGKFEGLETKFERLETKFEGLETKFEGLETKFEGLETKFEGLETKFEGLETKFEGLETKFEGLETKFEGVRDDLSLVKGGHARSAMVHNLPRIADEFGFQFIAAMPQTTVIEFAKMAKALGEEEGQIASFKSADMVMHVLDDKGQPAYVAIEASFTVGSNDVTRAVRNAAYLKQFTGLPSFPAVAGIAGLPEAQEEVDTAGVFLYKIGLGELQSE